MRRRWRCVAEAIPAIVVLAALPAFAEDVVQANANRLAAAAIDQSKAYETLSHLTDNIGPRPAGSRGAGLAVQWTTEWFRSWGIDVRNEKVRVPRWVRGEERAWLPSHNDQKIVLTALGGSVATPPKGLTAEVIEVASFDELKALGAKVKGKIVFYDNPMDMDLVRAGRSFEAYGKAVVFRGSGASRAAEFGAVAALIRSVGSDRLRNPHTGSLRYDPKFPKIPAAALTAEDAMLIHRLLTQGERVRLHLLLTPRMLPEADDANVVAEIRGSEKPDEIVLLAAHLDSWDLGTGAVDNGSGVAMVMEVMRLMKELGIVPKRTIRAVLFANEEFGLSGARAYVAAHKDEKHHAAIECDAGADVPLGFRTTLKGEALDSLEARFRNLQRLPGLKFESARQTGADTSLLVEAGVTGFGFVPESRRYFDYHHSPADTLDKVDPSHLAQDAAAVAALTYVLAEE